MTASKNFESSAATTLVFGAIDGCLTPQLLQRYLDGEFSTEHSASIERHLLDCDVCRTAISSMIPAEDLFTPRLLRDSTVAAAGALSNARTGVGLQGLPPRFVPLRRLGGGGMGDVWEVRDGLLNRVAALKFIRSELPGVQDLQRFRKEAEALARVSHPGIVRVYEVLTVNHQPALLMEMVAGPSLAAVVKGKAITDTTAARLVCLLADAVWHAHQQGVIHRDLKPGNILLRPEPDVDGRSADGDEGLLLSSMPLISDFGVAHLAGDQTLTVAGQLLGTPAYMAPEQASGDPALTTPAVDIYGLGAVLYELLTGRAPFVTDDPAATLALVQTVDPLAPRLLQPGIAVDIETICMKCLSKSPGDRYATAAALRDDLTAWLEGRPVLARPVSVAVRSFRWMRRNRLLAAVSVTAVSSLVVVIFQLIHFGFEQSRLLRLASAAEKTARERALEAETRAQLLNAHLTSATRAIDRLIIGIGPPGSPPMSIEQRRGQFEKMIKPFEDYLAWYCPNGVIAPEHLHVAQRLVWLKQQVNPALLSVAELQRIEDCIDGFSSQHFSDDDLLNFAAGYYELAAGFHMQHGDALKAADYSMKSSAFMRRRLTQLPQKPPKILPLMRHRVAQLMNAQQYYATAGVQPMVAVAARESCEAILEDIIRTEGFTNAAVANYMLNARSLVVALWNTGQQSEARAAASTAACIVRAASLSDPGAAAFCRNTLQGIEEFLNEQQELKH